MAWIDNNQIKALDQIGQKLVEAIRRKMEESGVNASGSLSESLEYVVTGDGLRVLALPYFQYAETGREAGAIPRDFDLILADWVRNKGITIPSQFADEYEFGKAIAWKIAKYGSLRKRTNNPVDLLSDPLDDVIDEVSEVLGKTFIQTINDNLPL